MIDAAPRERGATLEKAGGPGREAEGEQASPAPDQPVRVCFVIDWLGIGGTETQLLALIRNLDRSRISPYLVLLYKDTEQSREVIPPDCPVLRLNVDKLRKPSTLSRIVRMVRFLEAEKIDILQPYLANSTYFSVLTGFLARVPSIIRTRNNINHWMTPAHRRLGRLLNRFVTVTVCNSQAARNAVLADERPDPASVIVIANGVDLERFAHIPPVSATPDPTRSRRIGMVANLRPVKGVDVFVRAAALVVQSHPDVEFHVAGEGPQRPELEQLIADLGLQGRFMLHGKVADIPGFLATLDIAVLSSRSEGMPNAVLEYMAAGRPIVATAVGGTAGLLSDNCDALLVRPDRPEELVMALVRLLDNTAESMFLGWSGRCHVREKFSRETVVRHFEMLYDGLVQGTRRT